jgi:hypothetical protein
MQSRIPDYQKLKFDEYIKSDQSASGDKPKAVYICDGQDFFIKGHNNDECLGLEILAAKLFSLTGLIAPQTLFAADFHKIDEPDLAGNPDIMGDSDIYGSPATTNYNLNGSPDIYGEPLVKGETSLLINPVRVYTLDGALKSRQDYKGEDKTNYFIASKMLDNYMDFSSFVHFVNEHKRKLITPENLADFDKYYAELLKTDDDDTELPATRKVKRRDILFKIYELYPEEIRHSFEEMYATAIWLGNWDFLNSELENCGWRAYEKEDGTLSIKPAMVDFGNCLFTGFSGRHKEDSLERANQRAKNEQTHPDNYDPVIPVEKQISEHSAGFSKICEMLLLRNTPRREPFEELFKKTDNMIYDLLQNKQSNGSQLISRGFLRGIYRISLISDEAIEKTVNNWFHFGDGLDFADKNKTYSAQDLIEIMKARRKHLTDNFAGQIAEAKEKYPAEFKAAETKAQKINDKFKNDGAEKKHTKAFSWVAYISKNNTSEKLPNKLPGELANHRINNHNHQSGYTDRTRS